MLLLLFLTTYYEVGTLQFPSRDDSLGPVIDEYFRSYFKYIISYHIISVTLKRFVTHFYVSILQEAGSHAALRNK